MPVPRINFRLQENDKLMLEAMEKKLIEIIDAAGATKVYYRDIKPGVLLIIMEAAAWAMIPSRSVLNSFCQSHEVPNLFVVDSSCFVTTGTANPSLTIHAIAVRASEYIAHRAKSKICKESRLSFRPIEISARREDQVFYEEIKAVMLIWRR